MTERYCEDPDCRSPLLPLSPDNELAVHPKDRDFEFGSTIERTHEDYQAVLRIHQSCYSARRHVRA